jgi:hypothetical protein
MAFQRFPVCKQYMLQMQWTNKLYITTYFWCKIWGFYGSEDSSQGLLVCDVMQCFHPEDSGSKILQHVGILLQWYMALRPRRWFEYLLLSPTQCNSHQDQQTSDEQSQCCNCLCSDDIIMLRLHLQGEMVVSYHNAAWQHKPEDLDLNLHHCENLKSCTVITSLIASADLTCVPKWLLCGRKQK